MNQNEMIFFAVVIIAYILCAFVLNIPSYIHIIFGILLLAALVGAVLLKYTSEFENEGMGKIFYILAIILLIFYILATISELWFKKMLIINSGVFLVLFLIMLVANWFFRKK